MTGLRFKSQASAIWPGFALCLCAIASNAEPGFAVQQAMPIRYVDVLDISNAILFLASDEARYVTGMQMRVDAGGYLKWHSFHA